MRNMKRLLLGSGFILLLLGLQGCASVSGSSTAAEDANVTAKAQEAAGQIEDQGLPVRFQKPAYLIKEVGDEAEEDMVVMEVGTDLSSSAGPMPLREIIKLLVNLKDMTVSWASDVNQSIMVDVDIGIKDDFFQAIDNLLRQVGYFHEVQGNTIIIKHNETKRYHIAMPFMSSTYSTSVGGNVLGGTTASNQITSSGNSFDIWTNIETNLNRVFQIHAATEAQSSGDSAAVASASTTQGYYLIDRPIGLITVTAPRLLQEKIADYIDGLKKELYRQISIEAKIIEVSLTDESVVGINWSNLIQNVNAQLSVAGGGVVYPMVGNANPQAGDFFNSIIISPGTASGNVAVGTAGVFNLVLNAITKDYGKVSTLSNPKLITMNGQPAMINVGTEITYIASIVTTSVDGNTSTAITPDTVFEGLGMSIVPMITDDDEIIVSLTPVVSSLREWPIGTFTSGGDTLSTPEVNMREMTTVVRIKSGDTLVVGGMIKEQDSYKEEGKIPFLGDLPLIGGLFKQTTKSKPRTELVIIFQPRIL